MMQVLDFTEDQESKSDLHSVDPGRKDVVFTLMKTTCFSSQRCVVPGNLPCTFPHVSPGIIYSEESSDVRF